MNAARPAKRDVLPGAAATALIAASLLLVAAFAAQVDPGSLPAEKAPLAERSMLLDVAQAGSRLVAVGERGHVLLSDNRGQTWAQAESVPTQVLLTALCFSDERRGVAVGHDEVALVTTDAGNSWQRTHFSAEAQRPLLDVMCNGPDVIAVGAYGAYFVSHDRGVTWESRRFESKPLQEKSIGDEDVGADFHLNRVVAASGARLYIAGEAGHLYRSDDAGSSWWELPSPYEGSFFGVLPLDGDSLLAYGLRGNLFRSSDAGETWRRVPLQTEAMLNDAIRLPQDGVAIAGLAGTVLLSRDDGQTFTLMQEPDRKGISALAGLGVTELITVGEAGIRRIPLATSEGRE